MSSICLPCEAFTQAPSAVGKSSRMLLRLYMATKDAPKERWTAGGIPVCLCTTVRGPRTDGQCDTMRSSSEMILAFGRIGRAQAQAFPPARCAQPSGWQQEHEPHLQRCAWLRSGGGRIANTMALQQPPPGPIMHGPVHGDESCWE